MPDERAFARHTDPAESHAAAASVEDVTAKQKAVLALIEEQGPLSDHRLVELYASSYYRRGWPQQSESGLRTRRNELFRRGLIAKDSRKALLPSGRQAALWRALRDNERA